MSLYTRFSYDKDLADNGNWIPFGEGVEFKMRRLNSPLVQEKRRQLEQPYEALLRTGGSLGEDILRGILVNMMAESVILGWKGVTDSSNVPMEFSIANAKILLTDLPDLVRVLVDLASDRDLFKAAVDGEAAKNSVKASEAV